MENINGNFLFKFRTLTDRKGKQKNGNKNYNKRKKTIKVKAKSKPYFVNCHRMQNLHMNLLFLVDSGTQSRFLVLLAIFEKSPYNEFSLKIEV